MWNLNNFLFRLLLLTLAFAVDGLKLNAQNTEGMYVFDDKAKQLLQFQDIDAKQYSTYHTFIQLNHALGQTHTHLNFDLWGKGTVFFNEQLVYQLEDDLPKSKLLTWNLDSLRQTFGGQQLLVSFSGFEMAPTLHYSSEVDDNSSTPVIETVMPIEPRVVSIYSDEHIITFAFTMLLLVVYKMSYPKGFRDVFDFGSALRIRPRNEVFYDTRMLEPKNLLFYFLYGNIISLIAIWVFPHLIESYFPTIVGASIVIKHIVISSLVFTLLPIKGLFIKLFVKLFDVKAFLRIHFMDFLRIGFLGALFFFIISLLQINYNFFGQDESILAMILVLLLFVRIMMLLTKLINISVNERMYLFSYLCTIELVPFFFLVKFIIGVH